MLQLKDITKNYLTGDQKVEALKGININFPKNEFVCILGPSGCGKTTLLNIIGGLDKYTSGDLIINGVSTKNYKDHDWDDYRNKKIGFVFQNYNLIPHLTVLGNVEIALTISGISKSERRQKAKEALTKVGLQDQLHKKPNQLSGGQMQRVAIARAIINSPDILLADEPTGALDTQTSKQVMDIIKEISKDKLVIMVTHNPELAEEYSTRLIKMLDGNVIEDSKPYKVKENKSDKQITQKKIKREKKSSMSYLTAISLSWRNLITKKGRTILTSIAGSIGIIGIALILALSGGMNNYINKLQSDTLSSNPIIITENSINITQAMQAINSNEKLEKFPSIQKVIVKAAFNYSQIMKKNNITQDYIDYIKNALNPNWYSDISYKTGLTLNVYKQKTDSSNYEKLNTTPSQNYMMGTNTTIWQLLLNDDFILSQYDLIGTSSRLPANKNEIVLIIDENNRIPEETLISLGMKNVGDNVTEYDFNEIIGTQFKLVSNDLMYDFNDNIFIEKSPLSIDYNSAETLTIVGILRINPQTELGVLGTGIGYTKDLYNFIQNDNYNSQIVNYMKENALINPFTATSYSNTLQATAQEQYMAQLRALGGILTPNEINIYATTFENKNNIKRILNKYNTGKENADIITYTDMSELLGSALSSIVNTISYVLIGFTSISLIVSSIMISIITYVSVLERTKEIGILRSIGSRKKDVTRVFNSENILIGLIAGLFGIISTYLLSMLINAILFSLINVKNLANLNILSALLLIILSIMLSLVAGLIPAKKAAKLDPVTALRTE